MEALNVGGDEALGHKLDDARTIWHHLSRHGGKAPVIMARGQGLRLWDVDGREYLDASSGGVWCVNVGYGREDLALAVYRQLKEMPFYVASGGNLPAIALAKKLLASAPGLARVYLSNSGSEANEKAYKMLRLLAHCAGEPDRKTIVYRDRDYHGTTYGALASSGQEERRAGFGPFPGGFLRVPHALCYRCHFGLAYPGCDLECARAVGRAVAGYGPGKIVGGIFEPITAGGGVIVPVPEYYPEISRQFKKHGHKLIIDEVVCGVGRTGDMFAYPGLGLAPDIVTMAKGLASAYMPISVTATTEEIFKALQAGDERLGYFRDISTFGGSAAGPAAALENLAIIERENLLENVRRMGERLMAGIRGCLDHPNVGDVRGKGLLVGAEFVSDKKTKEPLPEALVIKVASTMAANGVLVGRTNRSIPGLNNVINFAPAYVATESDIDAIVDAFGASLAEALGARP
ncbi:MAG: aminotransferase class III-fold pyridoxal phosphate-dependent enzyme [Deltaproteobacteria bacterium]|jgi:taurine-pyruvate aminotransferase|nr:aminotransferase class III-fold pyridoxal phosphate-dependent enzyme [Deltaproteobacteria bacterium]